MELNVEDIMLAADDQGTATKGSETTLEDQKRDWEENSLAGSTLLLSIEKAFYSWTEIIPINTVDFAYKVLGLIVYGVDTASDYFIQLGYSIVDGSDPTTAQILGEREVRITTSPIARATELLDFLCSGCPANAKLWGRLKTDGGATDEAYVAVTLTRHITVEGMIPTLATWPWSK